jgi:tRNA-splicing ligase RtcB
MNEKISGKDLLEMGWQQGQALGVALRMGNEILADGVNKEEVLAVLRGVWEMPASYIDHPDWRETAKILMGDREIKPTLRADPAPLQVWGKHLIDPESYKQINDAALLPVTLRVALMPDAHVGYGLPIGGVAALTGAIAPYMVGVDIGCRMHATIFDRNPIHLQQSDKMYRKILLENTYFGFDKVPVYERAEHPILDDPRWGLLPKPLQNLRDRAVAQLGSSGGGNHFVEWTKLRVTADNPLGVAQGKYIALVSHSGSRGVGFGVANYYTKIAEKVCSFLPANMRKLGYLDYRAGVGEEYELAMNLAGDFAKACHEVIHARVEAALGVENAGILQNHHNFAWRVETEGDPVFIHRKGATPAAQGVVGIIPGSMATPGFFVEGICDTDENVLSHPSLNSAAHGSGRRMGRKQAHQRLDRQEVLKFLKKQGVTLLGGGLDEAPNAYKNSRDVIAAQADLVRVWAEFEPAIVRMAGDKKGKGLGERVR